MQKLQPFMSGPLRHLSSENKEEHTWVCARCGMIEPLHLRGLYLRRVCACTTRQWEQQRRQAMQQHVGQTRRASPFHWLGERWGMPSLLEKTFATFEAPRQPEAYEQAQAFARHPQGVFILYGEYGTGKTHLLSAIAQACSQERQACLFASTVLLFEAIQDRLHRRDAYSDLLKQAITTPLLLLDDLDKLKPSAFREEILYTIIDQRTSAARPLALSSNCPPQALDRWIGKAARSRLMMGLCPVQMREGDYRLLAQGEVHQDGGESQR